MHQYALEPNSGIHKKISIFEAIRFDSHPDGQVEGSPFSYIICTLYGSNQVSISIRRDYYSTNTDHFCPTNPSHYWFKGPKV